MRFKRVQQTIATLLILFVGIGTPAYIVTTPTVANAQVGGFSCLNSLFGRAGDAVSEVEDFAGGFEASGQSVPVTARNTDQILSQVNQNTKSSADALSKLESKEDCFDGIAFALVNLLIQQIGDSVVNWINSGFQGSPAFIDRPEEFFMGVANQASGLALNALNLNYLCQPFRFNLGLDLGINIQSHTHLQQVNCTILGVLNNAQNFANFTQGNFATGGMAGLLSVSYPQNNPYGAYVYSSAAIESETLDRLGLEKEMADWNRGFKSVSEKLNGGLNTAIKAPGAWVQGQVDANTNAGRERINVADEITEIISALVGQLIQGITSPNGLAGGGGGGTNAGSTLPTCANAAAAAQGGCIITPETYCPAGSTTCDPNAVTVDQAAEIPPEFNGNAAGDSNVIALRGLPANQTCSANNIASDGNVGTADLAIDGVTQTYSDAYNCGTPSYYWYVTLPQSQPITGFSIQAYAPYDLVPGTQILICDAVDGLNCSAANASAVYPINAQTDNITVIFPSSPINTASVTGKIFKLTSPQALVLREVKLFKPIAATTNPTTPTTPTNPNPPPTSTPVNGPPPPPGIPGSVN